VIAPIDTPCNHLRDNCTASQIWEYCL